MLLSLGVKNHPLLGGPSDAGKQQVAQLMAKLKVKALPNEQL
jgi:hypothetical protein